MTLRIGSNLADPLQTAQHARLSEDAGFSFLGAGEHVFRDNRPGSTQIALSALATAAGATGLGGSWILVRRGGTEGDTSAVALVAGSSTSAEADDRPSR